MIPLVDVSAQNKALAENLRRAYEDVFASGAFLGGRFLAGFEDAFSAYCGVPHAIGTASGTAALHLALRAMDIGSGDEVILPANTFIATAAAVSAVGATPVFADVDPSTLLMTLEEVERRLTLRTRALIPVHLFGRGLDLDPLLTLAAERGLWVIEDACQAHGARLPGRLFFDVGTGRPAREVRRSEAPGSLRAGGAGHAAAFSFYPAKNLGALGDAGALVTRDADLASRVRRLLDHGRTSHYDHEEWGYNFRMDALQAAFLAVKLPHLDAWNDARRRHVASYRAALSDLPVLLEPPAAGETHVHHIFAVRTGERDALLDHLRRLGVGASVHYPIPLHLMEAYRHRGGREGDFPVVERAARMLLSLPVFAELTEAAIAEVVRQVRGFFATARGIQ